MAQTKREVRMLPLLFLGCRSVTIALSLMMKASRKVIMMVTQRNGGITVMSGMRK